MRFIDDLGFNLKFVLKNDNIHGGIFTFIGWD